MPKFRKFLILIFGFVLLTTAGTVSAAKSSYYDYGPYYGNKQSVLGFSFSVLENLPAPKLPDSLIPPKAGGILPDSPFAFLDRVAENVQLIFTFDPAQKESLRWDQALERLQEAKTLIDQGKTEAALRAADDYRDTVSTVTDNLSNLPADTVNKIEQGAAGQAVLSQGLSFGSSPAAAEVWNLSLEASHSLLDKVADVKGQSPLPEDLSTGIQALKQQGLISEEESNKIYGLKNRAEVRDELEKLASSNQFPLSEIAKLDQGVAQYYPEVEKQNLANLQVAELQNYQSLPQPSKDIVAELNKWEQNQGVTPPNNIKPYLWYNRAQDLVKEVNLSNFSPDQRGEVARFYPNIASNPTYTPPKSVPGEPTPSNSSSPSPSPSPTPSVNYLGDVGGALPGDPTYFFKQFGENLSLTFTFNEADKSRLMMDYAERRLAEAKSLSDDSKKASQYEDSLQKYQQAVDRVSKYIKGIKDDKIAQRAAESLENQVARHEIALEKGTFSPPAQKPELISNAIKVAENAMDQAADTLHHPALPPALASRLDDLKTQGLILPEEVQDLTNSRSRQEVREKVRKLTELGTFPPADAKKLDEAEVRVSSSDYNQLVEVRKVEELQNLRSVQTELAQTPTLKLSSDTLSQREKLLTETIDPTLINKADLSGRPELLDIYTKLQQNTKDRPINRGQFGSQPPSPVNTALSICPSGATFKPSGGCVWTDSGKKINDYDQYRCTGPGEYYSFAAKKCVPSTLGQGYGEDARPLCPADYTWVWESQSCQSSGAGGDPKYRCPNRQYYSFEQQKCVAAPKPGDPYPKDTAPNCGEGTYWSFGENKCVSWTQKGESKFKDLVVPSPAFVPPDNPFYPVKRWGEFFQRTLAFTSQQREEVGLSQAKERLAEAADALKKDNKEGVKQAIAAYTAIMQNLVADVSKESFNNQAKAEVAKILADGSLEQNLLLNKLSAWANDEEDTLLSAASSVTILGIDKAADVAGEKPIPDEVKTKIEGLPKEMISDEDKKKLLETNSRVGARVELNKLQTLGGLTQGDTAFLDKDFAGIDTGTSVEIEELKKLAEIADITDKKEKIQEKVNKNEDISTKIEEFKKTYEPGKDIPSDVRPYIRLTRIDEVAQTVRPDVVNISDFQNRKDVVLAVATLQQEYRPTRESLRQVEDFRRRNPGAGLPPELARIEALSYSLGVREQAGVCFLPTPPFPANTPCPAPGAAIPISSYYGSTINNYSTAPYGGGGQGFDKDGKPLVYGQGPQAASAGVCPDGYHWMYDSGGWCMSNSGNYNASYNSTPGGYGPGYTPYSPYYTAPGAPGGTYPGSPYSYGAPSYYGSAPTYYTTNPPAGTVPGSGPRPTFPGQCPSGFHWMSDSGGWCMADGGTYVPSGGNYNSYPYSPNLNQSSCGPGYYWDGKGCIQTSPSNTYGSCQPPGGGCGYNSYWDYGSCSCRGSSSYYGGSGPSPSNSCQGISCGGGSYLDYSTCSCKSSYSSGYNTSTGSCTQQSCGSDQWFDWGTCSCRINSTSGGGGGSTTSGGSCPSGYHWMSDNGGWCMSDGGGSTSTSTSPSPSPSPSSSPVPSSEPSPSPSSSPAPSSEPSPSNSPSPSPS